MVSELGFKLFSTISLLFFYCFWSVFAYQTQYQTLYEWYWREDGDPRVINQYWIVVLEQYIVMISQLGYMMLKPILHGWVVIAIVSWSTGPGLGNVSSPASSPCCSLLPCKWYWCVGETVNHFVVVAIWIYLFELSLTSYMWRLWKTKSNLTPIFSQWAEIL